MGDDVSEARLVAAHASVGARDTVIGERRSLYGIAAREASVPTEDLAILDSPIARGAVGRSIGGGAAPTASQLVSLEPLSTVVASGNLSVTVGTDPDLASLLTDALALIGGLANAERPLVPLALGAILDEALGIATEGVALAGRFIPDLIGDILPHIGLVALLEPGSAGNLGSASAREFPGLVVIPASNSAIQFAEAIVHEGAHQKLFDLAITHDLYGHAASGCQAYCPPWSPPNTAWPLDQVLAAWHAYTCLSVFHASLPDAIRAELGQTTSLLPHAPSRSVVLLGQLLTCGRFLGADAHRLIEAVAGIAPADPPATHVGAQSLEGLARESMVGSGRVLAYRPGSSPLQLYWLPANSDVRASDPG